MGRTFSVSEDRETQPSPSATSTATHSKVNLSIVCTPGVHQKLVQQTALGMLPSTTVVQGQAQCTLAFEEQRMIRTLCCSPGGEISSASSHVPNTTAEPAAYATACKVTGDQTDKGKRGTKPIQFILCLFSIPWAVLPESSQGLEGCHKYKVHMHRYFLVYKVLCTTKGWSGREVS